MSTFLTPETVPVRQPGEHAAVWGRRVFLALVADPYGTGYFSDEDLAIAEHASVAAVAIPDISDAARERLQEARRILGAAVRARARVADLVDTCWARLTEAARVTIDAPAPEDIGPPSGKVPRVPAPVGPAAPAALQVSRPATDDPF
jgi:hypothetical protein